MKYFTIFASVALGIVAWCPGAFGQGATPGCKLMEAHCVCKKPDRDFKITNHRWAKANPSPAGDCSTKKSIEDALKKDPIPFCMSNQPSGGNSQSSSTQCQATWTCKEDCWVD